MYFPLHYFLSHFLMKNAHPILKASALLMLEVFLYYSAYGECLVVLKKIHNFKNDHVLSKYINVHS